MTANAAAVAIRKPAKAGNGYRIAIHTAELRPARGTAPDRIQLLPSGSFQGRDGRGPYVLADASAVIAATREHFGKADIPLDYNHQTELSTQNGQPAPAAGWITELTAEADGIWARVEWTERGAAAVASREFRYVSPVFFHDEAGNVLMLCSAALTNIPNLDLKALSEQDKAPAVATQEATDGDSNRLRSSTFNETAVAIRKRERPANGYRNRAASGAKECRMEFKEAVAQALGLSASASEVDIIAQARASHEAVMQAGKALNASDGPAGLVAAAQSVAGRLALAENPDPSKFVPMAMHEATTKELADLKAAQAKAQAEALVKEAQAAGKLTPAMEQWGRAYAAANPEGFKAWMASAPNLTPGGGADSHATAAAPGDGAALTAEQKAICAAFNLDENDYRKELSHDQAGK